MNFVGAHRERLEQHRDLLGPNVIDNTERGLAYSLGDVAWAHTAQTKIADRFIDFFDEADILICPAASVSPFPHDCCAKIAFGNAHSKPVRGIKGVKVCRCHHHYIFFTEREATIVVIAVLHERMLQAIPGRVPTIDEKIEGCAFHPRCARAEARCGSEAPQAVMMAENHLVRCHFPQEGPL